MWKIIYTLHDLILWILIKLKIHNYRQPYVINAGKSLDIEKFEKYLKQYNFEKDMLAWKDPGEILNMRKVDNLMFQYHVRVFRDYEIRGHYEYSPEGSPFYHITEKVFLPKKDYFKILISKFLENESKK